MNKERAQSLNIFGELTRNPLFDSMEISFNQDSHSVRIKNGTDEIFLVPHKNFVLGILFVASLQRIEMKTRLNRYKLLQKLNHAYIGIKFITILKDSMEWIAMTMPFSYEFNPTEFYMMLTQTMLPAKNELIR